MSHPYLPICLLREQFFFPEALQKKPKTNKQKGFPHIALARIVLHTHIPHPGEKILYCRIPSKWLKLQADWIT